MFGRVDTHNIQHVYTYVEDEHFVLDMIVQ